MDWFLYDRDLRHERVNANIGETEVMDVLGVVQPTSKAIGRLKLSCEEQPCIHSLHRGKKGFC